MRNSGLKLFHGMKNIQCYMGCKYTWYKIHKLKIYLQVIDINLVCDILFTLLCCVHYIDGL